jgi:hypothetical protein
MLMLFLIDQHLPVRIEAELVRQEQAHLAPQIVPPAAEPVAVAQDLR